MNVYVQSWGNRAGADRVQALARRVERDFGRFGRRIADVDVLIIDEGEDKGCIMEAHLKNADPIAVRTHAGTLESAVDKGADRIEQVIESRIHHLETIDFPDREQDLLNPVRDVPMPSETRNSV
jgi:hypothetical protein